MTLNPLSLIILLFFLAVVALALTLWFLLTLGTGAEPEPEPSPSRTTPPKPVVPLQNDAFRGAKAKPVAPAAKREDDAFERFIKSKNDELEF